MNQAQINYPQIEKEALAVKFGCKKFHEYVYGKQLTIESDHKPLESIFKKPLQNAPPRLQRIIFDVKQYAPTVIYKKGTEMYIADALSRDCRNEEIQEDVELELEIQTIIPMSETAFSELKAAIMKDKEMRELINTVQEGWPEKVSQTTESTRKYWNYRDEISVYDGIPFKNDRVIIPKEQRLKMLRHIHEGHFGIQSCLRRAREALYWPGMNKDVIDLISLCAVCQSRIRDPEAEPVLNKEVPNRPWKRIASDLFHFKSDNYVIIADSYSGYIDFSKLNGGGTSAEVIEKLKYWFSQHGIPDVLETDNGPQYSSYDFKKFSSKWCFTHETSSPHYPKANGLAERNVQIAKNMLAKCQKDKTDIYLALLNFRNTPRSETLGSPNQRLMSRRTKTLLPIVEEKLFPATMDVREEINKARVKQKEYADRTSKKAPTINVGDKIMLRNAHRNWVPAEVIENTQQPRSVIVQTPTGQQYRRNTSFIRPTKDNICPKSNPTSDIEESNDSTEEEIATAPINKKKEGYITRSGREVKIPIRLNL